MPLIYFATYVFFLGITALSETKSVPKQSIKETISVRPLDPIRWSSGWYLWMMTTTTKPIQLSIFHWILILFSVSVKNITPVIVVFHLKDDWTSESQHIVHSYSMISSYRSIRQIFPAVRWISSSLSYERFTVSGEMTFDAETIILAKNDTSVDITLQIMHLTRVRRIRFAMDFSALQNRVS